MPPLPESERHVDAAGVLRRRWRRTAATRWPGCGARSTGRASAGVAKRTALGQLLVTLLPALFIVALLGVTWQFATTPDVDGRHGRADRGGRPDRGAPAPERRSVDRPRAAAAEPRGAGSRAARSRRRKREGSAAPPRRAAKARSEPARPRGRRSKAAAAARPPSRQRLPTPTWFWIVFGVGIALLAVALLRSGTGSGSRSSRCC